MDVGILSRNSGLYSTSRLVEATRRAGHTARVIDYLRCYMDIASDRAKVRYRGEELRFDAVIPRIGAPYTFYGSAVVRQFEMMDVYPVATSEAINRSRDKLRSLQLLSRAGVGLPVTGFAHSTQDVDGLLELVGGAPVVVKLLEGTQGVGVVLAETRKAAESVIAAFRQLDANFLVQEFIEEAQGADIRAFVIGGQVVAAMRREAPAGEFRSNLHRGGSARAIHLSPTERDTAVLAAQTMGLDICGVDLVQSDRGPLVIEVNSSPGLEGIEAVSGIDIAGEIVGFIEGQVDGRVPSRTPVSEAASSA